MIDRGGDNSHTERKVRVVGPSSIQFFDRCSAVNRAGDDCWRLVIGHHCSLALRVCELLHINSLSSFAQAHTHTKK